MKNVYLKFVGFFLFFLLFYSCSFFSENGIQVEIKNLSDNTIKEVVVYTSDKKGYVNFNEIQPKEEGQEFLNMSTIANSDGGYMLKFRRKNGTVVKSGGGYYTHGEPLERKIIFVIKNDTVLVEIPLF